MKLSILFFFNDTATTEIYTLSLHDALPISTHPGYRAKAPPQIAISLLLLVAAGLFVRTLSNLKSIRSEEHTSELQSPDHLVCRLLLEKKKIKTPHSTCRRTLSR